MSNHERNIAQGSLQEMYYGDEQKATSFQRMKENPALTLGVAGALGMLAHGAYSYKHRGSMRTSIFLIHLRVRAQTMILGSLVLGICFTSLKDRLFTKKEITDQ